MIIRLNFLKKIRRTIKKFAMIKEGEGVVVGVSGGIDSIALLYSLNYLKEEYKISIVVAHLNHMVRGEQADRDAVFVEEQAKRLNLPCEIQKKNIPEYLKNKKGISLQMAAREVRYVFFESALNEFNVGKIALAHNKNDQAETIFMRLLRGSGITGLCGIPAVREEKIIRPLIEISRSEIEEFVTFEKISYTEDSTNREYHYLRNKIRGELFPLLKKDYNPNLINNLSSLGEILYEEEDFLKKYTDEILGDTVKNVDKNEMQIDLQEFNKKHLAIQRRILRACIKKLQGNLQRISMVHINAILDLVDHHAGNKVACLPDNLRVIYRKNYLTLKKI